MNNFYERYLKQSPAFLSPLRMSDPMMLEPVTRAAVLALLQDALSMGIHLMVFETYRSQARQELLFRAGATKLRTVGVHHYGLAADIVRNVNGEPSWKGDFSFLRPLAIKHGLVWGGDWADPTIKHSINDGDHLQRCSVADQPKLFSGAWYPGDDYQVQWG